MKGDSAKTVSFRGRNEAGSARVTTVAEPQPLFSCSHKALEIFGLTPADVTTAVFSGEVDHPLPFLSRTQSYTPFFA